MQKNDKSKFKKQNVKKIFVGGIRLVKRKGKEVQFLAPLCCLIVKILPFFLIKSKFYCMLAILGLHSHIIITLFHQLHLILRYYITKLWKEMQKSN